MGRDRGTEAIFPDCGLSISPYSSFSPSGTLAIFPALPILRPSDPVIISRIPRRIGGEIHSTQGLIELFLRTFARSIIS